MALIDWSSKNPFLQGIIPSQLGALAAMGFPQAQPAQTGTPMPVPSPTAETAPGVPRVASSTATMQLPPLILPQELQQEQTQEQAQSQQQQNPLAKVYNFLLRDPRAAAMLAGVGARIWSHSFRSEEWLGCTGRHSLASRSKKSRSLQRYVGQT